MARGAIGVVLASIAMYLYGFLFWGLAPQPYASWSAAADDQAAGQALLEHFPSNGVYMVPGRDHSAEEAGKLYEDGPVAMVFMTSVSGRPMMDGSIMAQGFVANVAVIILLAVLLCRVGKALPNFGAKMTFVLLVGVTAAVLVDVGDAVWWQMSWPWKLTQAFYHVTATAIAGAVLAALIRCGDAPTDGEKQA